MSRMADRLTDLATAACGDDDAAHERFVLDTLNEENTMFASAQEARSKLIDFGFISLTHLGTAEHWVRRGRHVILHWAGNIPEDADLDGMDYATAVRLPSGDIIISLD